MICIYLLLLFVTRKKLIGVSVKDVARASSSSPRHPRECGYGVGVGGLE